MSAKFKGQRGWIQGVLKNLEELEKHQPKPFNQNPEWPEWVWNLLVTLSPISYPGLKIKNVKRWKARDLGQFLGRHYAHEQLVAGEVPLSSRVIKEGEKTAAWAKKRARQKCPAIDLGKLEKQYGQRVKVLRPKFKKFMQEALSSACERPYMEASAFFDAFGKAIVIKPDDLLTERTMGVGDKICWVMVVLWPDIERLESVPALHRKLDEALKPHGIVVRYKRIEKLCQRIKLKFKGPGRPAGSKIQTNPTSV